MLLATQRNARLHLVGMTAAIGLGLWAGLEFRDWGLIALAIGLVWTAEAFNTSIELLSDVLHPEHHPGIGRVKDLAAGAVLFAAVTAAAIGFLTLGPPLVRMLAAPPSIETRNVPEASS